MQPRELTKNCEGIAQEADAGLTGVRLSPEVLSFCVENAVYADLTIALDAAKNSFSIIGNPVVELLADPEVGDTFYLVIEIRVKGEVRENVLAHRTFASATAKRLGSKREIIRLHYDII